MSIVARADQSLAQQDAGRRCCCACWLAQDGLPRCLICLAKFKNALIKHQPVEPRLCMTLDPIAVKPMCPPGKAAVSAATTSTAQIRTACPASNTSQRAPKEHIEHVIQIAMYIDIQNYTSDPIKTSIPNTIPNPPSIHLVPPAHSPSHPISFAPSIPLQHHIIPHHTTPHTKQQCPHTTSRSVPPRLLPATSGEPTRCPAVHAPRPRLHGREERSERDRLSWGWWCWRGAGGRFGGRWGGWLGGGWMGFWCGDGLGMIFWGVSDLEGR